MKNGTRAYLLVVAAFMWGTWLAAKLFGFLDAPVRHSLGGELVVWISSVVAIAFTLLGIAPWKDRP